MPWVINLNFDYGIADKQFTNWLNFGHNSVLLRKQLGVAPSAER
jgi:hypothetical protein